jgi:hypothetical protein
MTREANQEAWRGVCTVCTTRHGTRRGREATDYRRKPRVRTASMGQDMDAANGCGWLLRCIRASPARIAAGIPRSNKAFGVLANFLQAQRDHVFSIAVDSGPAPPFNRSAEFFAGDADNP